MCCGEKTSIASPPPHVDSLPSLFMMLNETLSNSTSASVVCLYPLSGQYELLQRILYWAIVAFTIFWHSHRWLVAGAFATVMLISSTATIHAIVLYGIRSKEYYDADTLAICEIIICSAVLMPAYLAHSKNLDHVAKRIVLQMWGSFLFLGGIFAILNMTHVEKRIHPAAYPCGDWTNTTWTNLDLSSWATQSNCSSLIVPCSNATHLMRPLSDVTIIKQSHAFGHWTSVIARFSTWLGYCSILVIVCSILVPAGTEQRRKWLKTQIQKQRATGRAKGNHPADTLQLPFVIMGGITFMACCEKTLSLIPRSESPSAIGQWASWVQLALVLLVSLVLRILTSEEGNADIPLTEPTAKRPMRSRKTQPDILLDEDLPTNITDCTMVQEPRTIFARIAKRFTDPVTKLEKGTIPPALRKFEGPSLLRNYANAAECDDLKVKKLE